MNITQRQQIIEIIKKDATLKGRYYEPTTGDACVIGGLALAAGVNPRILGYCGGLPISNLDSWVTHIRKLLRDRFGIDEEQALRLQRTNDYKDNTAFRREALIQMVNGFPVTD